MRKSVFLLCLCISFFSQIPSLYSATFRAILIGDTKDKLLNKVIKKDLKNMQNHIDDLFNSLDIEYLEQITYTGRSVNDEILDELKNLEIQSDDIVFMYFSGHGYQTGDSDDGQWPYLYFSREDVGVNQYQVMQTLWEHQPRLLICFVDCCSNVIEEDEWPETILKETRKIHKNISCRSQDDLADSNIQTLFNERGIIMISSASEGYYSEGTDEDGSCFTNCYIEKFQKMIHSKNEQINWDSLLSKTQKTLWKDQRPRYELILH
jgi:hypothetical protein